MTYIVPSSDGCRILVFLLAIGISLMLASCTGEKPPVTLNDDGHEIREVPKASPEEQEDVPAVVEVAEEPTIVRDESLPEEREDIPAVLEDPKPDVEIEEAGETGRDVTKPADDAEEMDHWTPAASSASAGSTAVRNLVAQGNIEYRQLRFDKALEKYDAAIRQDARYAIAHNNRGLTLHKLGKLDVAIETITRAKDLDESNASFWLNLGKVYAAAGQYDSGQQALRRALQLRPSLSAAVYNQLWILAQTQRWDEAATTAASLDGMPDAPPGSQMLRGIVEARRGQPRLLVEACCRNQDLPQLWRWLAEWNQCLGTGGVADLPADVQSLIRSANHAISTEQFAQARDYLTRAARAAPESPIPPWLAAMLCLGEGKNNEAEKQMATAALFLPKFRVASSDRGELLLYVDGNHRGRAPVTLQFLPGTHLISLVRRLDDGYSVFSKNGTFVAGRPYALPAVTFDRTRPLEQLSLPDHLRGEVETKLRGVVNSIGIKLALIPAGEFQMGSPGSDSEASRNEKPQHAVRITKPFYLGVTEVTQEQYERVMGTNPSRFKGPQLPVENVSWEDAVEYCRKLSALPVERSAGRVYRLPTEAEWEYACRAGSTTRYYFDDDGSTWDFGGDASMLGEHGWYKGNSVFKTQPVGQKKPNEWGLYDMHGNVWEWCSDWFSANYYANSPLEDPTGHASGSRRVCRGGSWSDAAELCRSASRSWYRPGHRYDNLGFRVAFSLME